ncbi:MAG: cytosine permease [Clostridia bacterium]|nr:cytosine permease [Clostridia bacterium]
MATYTQVEKNGLFELTDEARQELAASSYFNEDLAPTTVAQRNWTTYNISMLWVGMSICIPALALGSGLIGMGVSPWLSVLNVILGNIIILIPIQLNSQIGTKYGIPFPLFARLTFGIRGAHLPALLRALTACGWTSVQAWVGGGAFAAVIGVFVPKFLDPSWTITLPSWGGLQTWPPAGTFIGYVIFILFVGWVAYNGMDRIKFIQDLGGPILIIVMIALLIWSAVQAGHKGYSFFEVMQQPTDYALVDSLGGFWPVYLSALMGNIAFWATMALNIPDFSRYAKSQSSQFRGQLYGMPLPMALCAFVGTYFAQATKLAELKVDEDGNAVAIFDPTNVFYYVDNKLVIFIAAFGVVCATITTCVAANVVAPANGISNINPRKIGYKKGVIITILIAFFVLQAWWIYGNGAAYFTWMNAYGTILAPVAAIFIADYFVVKHKRVDIASMFKGEDGRYWYFNGINWAAVISWFVAFILPLLPYFGVGGSFIGFVNTINYVWSFIIGFVLYIILMKTGMKGNSDVSEEEHEAFTSRS